MLAVLFAATACGVGASPPQATLVAGHAAFTAGAPKTATVTVVPAKTKAAAPPHVFMIVLENESYSESYQHNPNPWLGSKLQKQGTLLTRYYATGHFSLDNYISMVSGQAPNTDTSADCQQHINFNNTTKPAKLNKSGQAIGTGCVFPTNVKTLANQLNTHHVTWHGYMEDMGNTPSREQKTCGVPTLADKFDTTETATPTDQYAARHNPFVYFHSLIDSGLCKKNVVPLSALPTALKKVSTTPDFSFITPDLCDDGHDAPCQGPDSTTAHGAGGLVSIDHFLSVWVPRIEKSPAFKKNGEIIITTDEASLNDDSTCCGEKPGPSDPSPGNTGKKGDGGGRIGTLVIGKCVKPDVKDTKPYNHYSLLRSLENIYGIKTGGSDGKGHLGYAGAKGLRAFGKDLFSRCTP
jgi:phosphatidylinositol-3-phosphatase